MWVFVGDERAAPDRRAAPGGARRQRFTVGGRVDVRHGNWRLAAENGFDEGHAKYLHRTSWWRLFKVMPTWNKTHIEDRGRWIYRVQDEVHWDADFPGVGHWTNKRWWKIKPPEGKSFTLGNTGAAVSVDPHIERQEFPGFVSLSLPGVLRVAYPQFIHYEFYVPVDETSHRYVGVMVQFKTGAPGPLVPAAVRARHPLALPRQLPDQDAWMVEAMDAPPERMYRPDISLVAWRRLCEKGTRPGGLPNRPVRATEAGAEGNGQGDGP